MKKIVKITPVENVFSVSWIAHIRCNYDCMYCPEDRHNDYDALPSIDVLKSQWNQIFAKTQHRNLPYKLCFSGGEATINKDFIPFLEWLNQTHGKYIQSIVLTSNGSASVNYYKKLFGCLTHLSVSNHFEHVDERFFDKVKTLSEYAKSQNKMLFVNVMQEYWATEQVVKLVNFCKTHDIPHAVSKVIHGLPGSRSWPIFRIDNKTAERRDLEITQKLIDQSDHAVAPLVNREEKYYSAQIHYDDNTTEFTFPSEIRYFERHQFKGWRCHAGLDRIFVLPDTSVYNGECQNAYMGRLSDNTFELYSEPGVCKLNYCTNNPDDMQVTKYVEQL